MDREKEDCGCGYGGRLGCVRLDDLKEFYVGKEDKTGTAARNEES